MHFSRMRNRDGHDAVEYEKQVFYFTFRDMGKNLDNIIRRSLKAYMSLFGNVTLPDLDLGS